MRESKKFTEIEKKNVTIASLKINEILDGLSVDEGILVCFIYHRIYLDIGKKMNVDITSEILDGIKK